MYLLATMLLRATQIFFFSAKVVATVDGEVAAEGQIKFAMIDTNKKA